MMESKDALTFKKEIILFKPIFPAFQYTIVQGDPERLILFSEITVL